MPHRSFRSIALVLAAAGVLQACGGCSRSNNLPHVTQFAGATQQSGTIVLPPGVNLTLSALVVSNSMGHAAPSASGSFSLRAYAGGPQFTLVTDKAGNPILAGFLGPGSTTIDSLSTAKLLTYFAGAFYTLPSPYREQMVDAIATAPGFSAVQNAVIAALQAHPTGLATDPGVTSALTTFITTLYAPKVPASASRQRRALAGARSRLDVLVNPGGALSGITTINDFPDGIHFMNTYRRAAEAFIDQDSYVDQSGTRVYAPVNDVVPPVQIPAVSGLSNVTSSLVAAVQGIFTGATQYTPVSTASTPLSNLANAKSTRYIVTVVGPGPISNPNVVLRREESSARDILAIRQMLQNFLVPIVASIVIPLNSEAIDEALAFQGGNNTLTDLITTLTTDAPQIAGLMEAGRVSDALMQAFNTVATSGTVQAAFLQFVQNSVQNASGVEAAQKFFENGDALLNDINVLSSALVVADIAVVVANIGSSHNADQFTVDVTADRVTLTPGSATLPNNGTQVFTANVPSASGSGTPIVWRWANTATAGHITDGINGHQDNFDSSSNTVTYTANATGTGNDTVTVTAFEVVRSTRVQIGNPQTATVSVQSGLCNGDFSKGFTCWTQTTLSTGTFAGYPHYSIESSGYCLGSSGNPFYSVDVPGNAVAVLSQTFPVPTGNPTLYMYTWGALDPVTVSILITPSGGSAVDIGDFVPPPLQATETTCSGAVPVVESFSLSNYAGQMVTLGIWATSGGADGTIAHFDDIGFSVPPTSYIARQATVRR